MPKQLWKSLDEYYGAPEVEAARSSEFSDDIERSLDAIRREYGIDDEGNIKDAGQERDASPAHIDDLRQLLPDCSRRGFLKLTGAAAVFGMAGCWHEAPETLVPYVEQPENAPLAGGVYYSSLVRNNGSVRPVMVKLYDGRPIKIEGNPDCRATKGTLDLRGQAALLDLYDPDRRVMAGELDGPRRGNEPAAWNAIDAAVGESIKTGNVGLITGPWNGPSHERLLKNLNSELDGRLRHAVWHPHAQDTARQARAILFGDAAANDPVYHVDQADLLVTLGSDLLGGGTSTLADHVNFGEQRRIRRNGAQATMGQVIAFEPTVSQTGTCSDVRSRVAMEDMAALAWYIAEEVARSLNKSFPTAAKNLAAKGAALSLDQHPSLSEGVAAYTIKQLLAVHKDKRHSLVYVGGAVHCGERSLGLHLAAAYLNSILGNEGHTVTAPAQAMTPSIKETQAVLEAAAKGEIQTLILADANLAYDWPDRAAVEAAVAGAAMTVVIADRDNETASLDGVDAVLPSLHDLESWGDASLTENYVVQQPAVLPLWNARATEESLMAFLTQSGSKVFAYTIANDETFGKFLSFIERKPLWHAPQNGVQSWHQFVQQTWTEQLHKELNMPAAAQDFWKASLSRGLVNRRADVGSAGAARVDAVEAAHLPASPANGLSLICSASRTIGDGSQANNAWLQETADPVSRNTWDNYVAVSIADAHAGINGKPVKDNQVLKLTVHGQTAWLPALVQPGMAQGTLEIFSGWGRTHAGAVAADAGYAAANNQLNAFQLAGSHDRWGIPVTVEVTDDSYDLACMQGHDYMDGRAIALDDALESHAVQPAADAREGAHHHSLWHAGQGTTDPHNADITTPPLYDPNNLSLWDSTHVYTGRRWGMVIDMNACTGCNACVVACSAENNVPVVGRDEVRLGREMHWIRIDRYYSTYFSAEEQHEDPDRKTSEKIEGEGHFGRRQAADDSFVEFIQQPMLCQQCGHAPCEEVCPAMATMHNEEGINIQVYNRCIGTRYCANNCPYKVRRFNFYEYSKYRFGPQGSGDPLKRVVKNLSTDLSTSGEHEMLELPLQMMLNPAVIVRSKGVMEKCNFCVSRTREIRESEKRSNKKYDESTATSACAQTCPTQAITFGDINDPDSTVSRMRSDNEHGYLVLDNVLNTRPAITYLRRVRNRPPLPGTEEVIAEHDHGHDHAHGEGEPH